VLLPARGSQVGEDLLPQQLKLLRRNLWIVAVGAGISVLVAWACPVLEELSWSLGANPRHTTWNEAEMRWRQHTPAAWPSPTDRSCQVGLFETFYTARAEAASGSGQFYSLHQSEVGWPARALSGWMRRTPSGSRVTGDRLVGLSTGVIWLGLLADTAVYSLLLWCAVSGGIAARQQWRVRRGRCRRCGYPVGMCPDARKCPECGATVSGRVVFRNPHGSKDSAQS